jgi:endonuclease/exonuclease/phosphatase family metal-dependent hydrolase
MPRVRVASFNVENLFARPKAFDPLDWSAGLPVLAAYSEVNELMARPVYGPATRERLRELLLELGVYGRNRHGAVRRRFSRDPRWAWLRANRGTFDRQPRDPGRDVEVVARGRADWIGWVELAKGAVNEIGTRTTARVVADVDADVLAIVEAEDRPSLLRLNSDLLGGRYGHAMLVDGNDERGIDVGLLAKPGFEIRSVASHVDDVDEVGTVFSRDCADYEVVTPGGEVLHVLVNHFKSQSGGGEAKRRRQAVRVRRIAEEHIAAGRHVVVAGDLNEGPPAEGAAPPSLQPLFDAGGPLTSCWDLPGFDPGPRPGTFDACGLRSRLDYVLLSPSLRDAFRAGTVFRRGLWGTRVTRPDRWETYPEMTEPAHQASDHAAVLIDLEV